MRTVREISADSAETWSEQGASRLAVYINLKKNVIFALLRFDLVQKRDFRPKI